MYMWWGWVLMKVVQFEAGQGMVQMRDIPFPSLTEVRPYALDVLCIDCLWDLIRYSEF